MANLQKPKRKKSEIQPFIASTREFYSEFSSSEGKYYEPVELKSSNRANDLMKMRLALSENVNMQYLTLLLRIALDSKMKLKS